MVMGIFKLDELFGMYFFFFFLCFGILFCNYEKKVEMESYCMFVVKRFEMIIIVKNVHLSSVMKSLELFP